MTKKERYKFVIEYFEKNVPDAETELIYDTPYELLVAVILSAQCTDKRVNITTPAIFKKATSPLAVEKELIQHFPEALIHKAHHWLILHGRYTCLARNPKCLQCGIKTACLYFKENLSAE